MRHSDLIGFDKKMIMKSNAIDFFQIGWIGMAENSSEGLSFFFSMALLFTHHFYVKTIEI